MKTAYLATASLAATLLLSTAPSAFAAETPTAAATAADEVVVTATARPELRSRVAGTVQVIEQETIARSTSKSLTDLFAENSVAFLSEWTPAQTSINIRGGASDGQGRDYLGDVLGLVNGRRAGTANLSKLSANDVDRIEIVRGPASVLYGSQNIGGVVNIISRTGRTGQGVHAEIAAGSWGLKTGRLSWGSANGPVDWYLSLNGGQRGDYESGSGGGKMIATQYKRLGAEAALGYQFDANNRFELIARSDGTYDTGFRGSGSNIFSFDNRYNHSLDFNYAGHTKSDRFSWNWHIYGVLDVDELNWASPVIKSGVLPVTGTSIDHNIRRLNIFGQQFRPQAKLWAGNVLTVGYDWELARLRSDRFRAGMPGQPVLAQVSPLDNNQTDRSHAYYFEDAQTLLDDRLTVRGGARWSAGTLSFDPTPFLALQRTGATKYDATTYSVGAAFKVIPDLTLRVGTSTGFRVPSATQLGADFTALGGGRIFGNPNLKPETSKQIEFGALYSRSFFTADVAIFRNVISNRIVTILRPPPAVANTSDYGNNPADLYIRGLELQTNTDLLRMMGKEAGPWRVSAYFNGYYNFNMKDKGAVATANTRNITRMYRYESSLGLNVGQQGGAWKDWSVQLGGIFRGPVFYDTEENLLIPLGEPVSTYVHRKSPFWVWNLRGDVKLTQRITVQAAINNILDKNAHPIFIATDSDPRIADPRFQNGTPLGTSMPGREFVIRLKADF